MKVEIINKEKVKQEIVFPCLLIDELTGTIIWAEKDNDEYCTINDLSAETSTPKIQKRIYYSGTVVKDKVLPSGKYIAYYEIERLKPFYGKIILSND